MAIAITHPGARLLAPALDALADVAAGDWTTAARLCAARLQDPAACALDLDLAASRAGVTRSQRQQYRYWLHGRMLFVDEHPALQRRPVSQEGREHEHQSQADDLPTR